MNIEQKVWIHRKNTWLNIAYHYGFGLDDSSAYVNIKQPKWKVWLADKLLHIQGFRLYGEVYQQ